MAGWRSWVAARTTAVLLVLGSVASGGVALVAGPAAATTVQVRPGDNLTIIAHRYGVSVSALANANHLSDPNHVLIGSVLQVPTPDDSAASAGPDGDGDADDPSPVTTTHTVVVATGDTLTAIAARAGTTVAAIVQANGLRDPDHVLAGSHLVVPSGPASTGGATSGAPGSLPPALVAHPDRLVLRPLFQRWAATFNVPAPLLEAMCWWESGWQASVVSSTGAVGVCQLEPATVAALRAQLHVPALDPASASDNIEMSAAYVHDLLAATGGDERLALAGYYQGLASVRQIGMLLVTQRYVQGILAYSPAFS